MRSLPETRSRRLSDSKLLRVPKIKRLKNGCAAQHVTTRSQVAKSSPKKLGGSRVISNNNNSVKKRVLRAKEIQRAKRNGKPGSTPNGVLHHGKGTYLERKVGAKAPTTKERHSMTNGHSEKRSESNNHHPHNNNASSNNSSYYLNGATMESDSKRRDLARSRAEAAEKRADRLNKRRSALWVLNCEAESFLFGDTAADGKEVDLPPASSPPKKRRRMRTNELGDLLKESPILCSKLRSPPLSSPASSKLEGGRSRTTSGSEASENSGARVSSSLFHSSSKSDNAGSSPKSTVSSEENELVHPRLPVSFYNHLSFGSPLKWLAEANNINSVRIQNILSSMEWRFSFEELPSDETWYATFKRQQNNRNSLPVFDGPKGGRNYTPVLLPYETKVMSARSPTKRRMPRLPRKSPRCHASTLAILSSLKQRGRPRLLPQPTFTSGLTVSLPPMSPPPSTLNSPLVSPASAAAGDDQPPRLKRMYTKRAPPASELCSPSPLRTPTLPPVSPPQLPCFPSSSASHVPSPASPASSPTSRIRDLSATQYLWDSIQLLSDPYVIQILAGDRPKSPRSGSPKNNVFHRIDPLLDTQSKEGSSSRNDTSSNHTKKVKNNNNCMPPLLKKNCQLSQSFLEAAMNLNLESKLAQKCNVTKNNVNNNNNNNNNNSNSTSKANFKDSKSVISVNFDPKTKRLNVNGKNLLVGQSEKLIQNGVSSNNNIHKNNNNNNSRFRKSNRKSPVVLVADIFKNPRHNSKAGVILSTSPPPSSPPATNNNSNSVNCSKTGREELLFLMEGIPPLPAWPV